MRYSRAGIVAVLLAVETVIAGGIVAAVAGTRFPAYAAGLHTEDTASGVSRSFTTGSAPHVVVDDTDARIVVAVSADQSVRVSDQTRSVGLVWSRDRQAPLQMLRTSDGVLVRRASSGPHLDILGWQQDRVEVMVPAGAFLDLRGCDGADITGLRAQNISVNCQDGSLRIHDLHVEGGTLRTADGSIRLELTDANLTVHAKTADGSLRFNGNRVASGDDDASEGIFHVGSGSGRLEVATQDGSIRIATNGVR
jgi:hypothetical protein